MKTITSKPRMPTTDVRSLWKYSSHVTGKYNLYLIFFIE